MSLPPAGRAPHVLASTLTITHNTHADVKPANVMLASLYPSVLHLADPSAPKGDLDIKMIDFGCARPYGDGMLEGLSGTPVYLGEYELAKGDSVHLSVLRTAARGRSRWRVPCPCRCPTRSHAHTHIPFPLAPCSPRGCRRPALRPQV